MKFISLIICCFLLTVSTFAQAPKIISSSGEIPAEFLTASSEKYADKIENYRSNGKENSRTKKSKKKFYLESSFEIDDLLRGGNVLFNDELGKYANDVLAQLPISESLKKKKNPRIYIVKSNEVNAFATEQGIIFVTIGLLANIESEAHLAFILAHEISHIEEDHGLDKFLTYNTYEGEQWLKKLNRGDNIFTKSLYSQQLESEADSLGLELFLDSEYEHDMVEGVFTTLYYSYLSYSEESFNTKFFDDENYILPSSVWLDTVNAIQPMEDGNDESTHPASAMRMELIKNKTADLARENKGVFVLDKSRFDQIQETSRFQLPFLCIEDGDNVRAIYNAYILLQKYPDNIDLKKVIAKALYMETKFQQSTIEDDDNSKKSMYYHVKKMEGALHRLGYLFKELSYKEFGILALKYNYELWLDNQDDKQLDMAVQSLMNNLAGEFDNLDSFKNTARPKQDTSAVKDLKQESSTQEKKKLTREEKISRANKKKQEKAKEEAYIKYAFVDYVDSEDFVNRFQESRDDLTAGDEDLDENKRTFIATYSNAVTEAANLGINKIVVVNPEYVSLKNYKNQVQYLKSEEKTEILQNQIKDMAKKIGLKLDVLDVSALQSMDVDAFTDISELQTYFQQQLSLPSYGLHPSTNQNELYQIAESYGTEYFLYTGVIAIDNYNINLYGIGFAALFPPYFAHALFDESINRGDTFYYAILFDVKTGRRRALKLDILNVEINKKLLDAHIYDALSQIKN